MESADVIVVGAGLAGLSTAWHLPAEWRVIVVEQGQHPAMEASAQNSGLLRRMDLEPAERALAKRTWTALQAPHTDWPVSPTTPTGAVLALGRDPLHLHDAVAHLKAGGVRVLPVRDPEALSPALQCSPLVRAWHLPDEQTIDLPKLVDGFLAGLARMKRSPRCGVQVTGFRQNNAGDITGVDTTAGALQAPRVVLAGGAWCQPLAATIGLHRPLIPLRRTVAICRSDVRAHGPWVWVDDVGVYVRPEGTHWLASPCDEVIDPPGEGPGSTGVPDKRAEALLRTKLAKYFPQLAQPTFIRGWTGLRTFAPDRRPMLGSDPAAPGLWWAAGLGGAGLSGCFGVGEALAGWMTNAQIDWLDPHAIHPGRAQLSRWAIQPDGDPQHARLVRVQGP